MVNHRPAASSQNARPSVVSSVAGVFDTACTPGAASASFGAPSIATSTVGFVATITVEGAGFGESKVRAAWRMKSNDEIAATVVGYIRQRALGGALVPYETRVDHALDAMLKDRPWSDEQRRWLTRIASQMKAEVVVDRGALDRGAFTTIGGARRAERVFDGRLDEVLGAMADAAWDDVG